MRCSNCNSEIIEGNKFCVNCGTPVVKENNIQNNPINNVQYKNNNPTNNNQNLKVLDTKCIMGKPKIFLILVLLFFFIMGVSLIIFSLTLTKTLFNTIAFMGSIICLTTILSILFLLKYNAKIRKEQYAIVLDVLMDKEFYSDVGSSADTVSVSSWRLYFKNYFKKYDNYICLTNKSLGLKYNIGDEFYLIFVKGFRDPYIYSAKEYDLAESTKSKLMTLDEAKEYINLKEFVLKAKNDIKNGNEKVIISKKKIKKDFTSTPHISTMIVEILVCICLLLALIMVIIYSKNLIAILGILFFILVFGFFTVLKVIYVYKVYSNIHKGNIRIKLDEVVSLNNLVEFRESNSATSFKFKNYKKIVFADKKEYPDVKIGDEFYLVFVRGEKEPIKVYSTKNSVLDDDMILKKVE